MCVCVCVCVVCVVSVDPHRDGVDVAGVSTEGLLAGPVPQVPQLGQGVAGSGDEGVHVGGQSQRHAVSDVVGEHLLLLTGLQVPQAAGGGGAQETVGRVCFQIWTNSHCSHVFLLFKKVLVLSESILMVSL